MKFYIPKHKKTENKKSVLKKITLPLTTSILFIATVAYWNNKNYGLALEYNGQQIATVQNQEVYEKAKELINDQVQPNEKHKINKLKPQIKLTPVAQEECCEKPEEIKNKIIENSGEILNSAFGLYVNDKIVCVAKTKEEINKAIDEIIKSNESAHQNSKAEIEEKIKIKEGLFEDSKIETYEKVKEKLCSQTEKIETYTVKNDDTVLGIAEKFGITAEKLLSDNNKSSEDQIFKGEKLNIILPDTLIHVKVVVNESTEEEIPYQTISEEDKNLEKGKTIVFQAGSNGTKEVSYKVTYLNGKEIKKEQVESKIKNVPIDEKQKIGTKQKEYIWPVPFTKNITSPFGPRWGTYHYGIDISCAGVDGKDIVATKDGTVEKASKGNKGYGNYIIINHQDGTKTLYGHCKSLNVSEGQSVSQGDKIASVGSTGDSTGPHLHFEVRINNERKNPQNYVD